MRKTERSVTLKGNKRKDRKFFKENWKKWNNNLILKCKFNFILCNSSLNEVFCFYSPSENKERNNGTSTSKEDAKAEENSSVAKPDKESSGAVDFDLALDYEEMDAAQILLNWFSTISLKVNDNDFNCNLLFFQFSS